MPFLRLEISREHSHLAPAILDKAGERVTELFSLDVVRVKSTVFVPEYFQVGDPGQFSGFAHLSVHCFKGRLREVNEKLSSDLIELLRSSFSKEPGSFSLAAYLVEIEPATTKVEKLLGA